MKKRLILGTIILLILWFIATVIHLDSTEQTLTSLSNQKLSDPIHQGLFNDIKIEFKGQEATLTGNVGLEETKRTAEKIIATEIRTPDNRGAKYNPVKKVHNHITVDPAKASYRHPWLIASIANGEQRLDGYLKDPAQANAILAKAPTLSPSPHYLDQILRTEKTLPTPDWDTTLNNFPDLKKSLEGKKDKDLAIITVTTCDGTWTNFPPTATNQDILAALKNANVGEHEINSALHKLRTWHTGPSPEELARIKAEQDKKIAEQQKAAEQARLQALAEANKNPAWLGITAQEKNITLIGSLPAEQDKQQALTSAATTYVGYTLNASGITLDPTRTLPPPQHRKLTLPPAPANQKNFIAIATYDGTSKSYPHDAFDSEISRDFPNIKFTENELTQQLTPFRTQLAKAGTLQLDTPYLSLISDGKNLTLTGEIADEPTKKQLLEKITASHPDLTINDKTTITPLVKPITDITATLQTLPINKPGQPSVAIALLGQKWRTAVVHSIYFPTGSDRSKDTERAVTQMKRILTLLPTAKFEIIGHTDNVGNPESNKKLSTERATAFQTYAANSGISPTILTSRGAGQEEPIASNDTDTNKALNRRVDVTLKP